MRLDVIEPWGELILIALAVGQGVRDDELRLAVRGAARRPRLLTWLLAPRRPALLFRRGAGPRLRLGCRLGFRLERRLGLADLGQPLRLVGHPVLQLVAPLVL